MIGHDLDMIAHANAHRRDTHGLAGEEGFGRHAAALEALVQATDGHFPAQSTHLPVDEVSLEDGDRRTGLGENDGSAEDEPDWTQTRTPHEPDCPSV
jgi:hypothetical protein